MADWPEQVQRQIHESLDSTMSEAARQRAALTGPTWILAKEQTAARGRRGRVWHQPKGNFSATLIYRPDGPIDQRALRSFVASLALREALIATTGKEGGISLKWPNDVLMNGGKIAGILLESIDDSLAIGIGVNLVAAPAVEDVETNAQRPVSLRGETGLTVSPEEFLTALATSFAAWEARFTSFGFEPIRNEWMRHAAKLGGVLTARTASEDITGTFETVDEQGVLVLKAADGRHRIAAADVFFQAPEKRN